MFEEAKITRKYLARRPEQLRLQAPRLRCPVPPPHPMAWRRALSTKTEYLIRDIGMYVGKTFVTQYPKRLSWTYRSAPQSDIFVNTPLLTGFVQTRDMRGNALPQPFHPEFEPIHRTGVQAVKILDGRQANEDLYRICLLWSGWIPIDGDRGQPRA